MDNAYMNFQAKQVLWHFYLPNLIISSSKTAKILSIPKIVTHSILSIIIILPKENEFILIH